VLKLERQGWYWDYVAKVRSTSAYLTDYKNVGSGWMPLRAAGKGLF